ncbi:Uncharacterized protein TCM_010996 [Theobroma cacao]|uniref:Uncharacterized protein n=1 Tax=Theobroma cacao TaxID=3641 RepID=A0A061E8T6_THECC|nr:Uncharacterized protein TCM_010996 [Theobroma cacao]
MREEKKENMSGGELGRIRPHQRMAKYFFLEKTRTFRKKKRENRLGSKERKKERKKGEKRKRQGRFGPVVSS